MNQVSNKFDERNAALDERIKANKLYSRSTLENIVSDLSEKVKNGSNVLDLGCGNGNFYQALSKKNQYFGIDISHKLLIEFRKKFKESFPLLKSSMDNLPFFMNGSFDAIFSIYSIYYTEKPRELISKIFDMLSDNGVLFVMGPSQSAHAPEIDHFLKMQNAAVESKINNKNSRLTTFHDHILPLMHSKFRSFSTKEIDSSLDFPDNISWARYVAATPQVIESIPKNNQDIYEKALEFSVNHRCYKISKSMVVAEANKQ